jgi:hypothetical protein
VSCTSTTGLLAAIARLGEDEIEPRLGTLASTVDAVACLRIPEIDEETP